MNRPENKAFALALVNARGARRAVVFGQEAGNRLQVVVGLDLPLGAVAPIFPVLARKSRRKTCLRQWPHRRQGLLGAQRRLCDPSHSAPFALVLQPQKYTVSAFGAVKAVGVNSVPLWEPSQNGWLALRPHRHQ
jgi:hypothetical protein